MSIEYHLAELEIARSASDPRKIMPIIPEHCRSILDVGCGMGQLLMASRSATKAIFYGIDVDFPALKLGRKLTKEIQFLLARGEDLPFRDNSFDMLICRLALPYMDVNKGFAEFWRVLKPNGLLWLALYPFSEVAKHFMYSLRSGNLRNIVFRSYVIANGLSFHLTGWQFRFPLGRKRQESFQTDAGTRRVLRLNGFSEIEIRREPHFEATARKPC